MKLISLEEELKSNSYPGRGIIIGKAKDGESAVAAYFIMGRSENSRNRIFKPTFDGIKTEAHDPQKLSDPSLIIYSPVRAFDDKLVVTNGDQTDTIVELMTEGKTFEQALKTREFEPDEPNYTPRISGILDFSDDNFEFKLSILKSDDMSPVQCERFTFSYDNILSGEGRFIHTYKCDGNPIPSFEGEPKKVSIPNNIDEFADLLWNSLNSDNKVSLFVRYINLKTKNATTKIINKNN